MPSKTRADAPLVKSNVPPLVRGVVYVTSTNPLVVHGGVGLAVGDGAGLGEEGAVWASLRANDTAISATNTSAPVKSLRKNVLLKNSRRENREGNRQASRRSIDVYDIRGRCTSVQTDRPHDRIHSIASELRANIRLSVNRLESQLDKKRPRLRAVLVCLVRRTIVYAARRSSVTFAEIDFAGSGTEIKITIMATNAASDIKLSTDSLPISARQVAVAP